MNAIFQAYGLSLSDYLIEKLSLGHIHQTYRLKDATGKGFILQRVNKNIFKDPEIIASNLKIAGDYLLKNFPSYNFLRNIPTVTKSGLCYDDENFPWRLFHYQQNTKTIEKVDTEEQALKAAQGFAELTACLNGVDVSRFKETIPEFHDLSKRYKQFLQALDGASADRKQMAGEQIFVCQQFSPLVEKYKNLISSEVLQLRVMHNDTKINNILFDSESGNVVSVIDLDTLMPGYFIYDVGDMIRTFVSPVSEEEKDYSKIRFRTDIYNALLEGYLLKMGNILSDQEKSLIPFAGKMMTYIMALRFLIDYLNNDVYYQTHYEGQNLVRAGNQLSFLQLLEKELR